MHTHTPISEVARALASRAEDISVALLGEPTSRSRANTDGVGVAHYGLIVPAPIVAAGMTISLA